MSFLTDHLGPPHKIEDGEQVWFLEKIIIKVFNNRLHCIINSHKTFKILNSVLLDNPFEIVNIGGNNIISSKHIFDFPHRKNIEAWLAIEKLLGAFILASFNIEDFNEEDIRRIVILSY